MQNQSWQIAKKLYPTGGKYTWESQKNSLSRLLWWGYRTLPVSFKYKGKQLSMVNVYP
jgi:hypothetical protein